MRPLTRRSVVVAGAAGIVGLGACSAPSTRMIDLEPTDPPDEAPGSGQPAATSAPPPGWEPHPNEVTPAAKVAAARHLEQSAARHGAMLRVIYPQYGGLLDAASSVMVLAAVTDQIRSYRTYDVRLRRAGRLWSVIDTAEFPGPEDAEGAALATVGTPEADAVRDLLTSPRVDIRGAAAADLVDGRVDRLVVRLLLTLAEEFRISVTVFASGHPREVFGTEGLSNHTLGRAVDLWAIDGRPVIEMPPDDPLLLSFLTRAAELGCTEIGAPIDPDGPGGVHFANALHRDHVHLGFDRT